MNHTSESKQNKHQSLKKILADTVTTVRERLNCDRVVIYNAKNLPEAGILAESVAPKCPSLLGKTVKDPFLKDDFLEMYCYGMSLTIDDIYSSEISQDDIASLEQLGVKSAAIAPIYIDNKLLAFLSAHQCSASRFWNLETIRFLAEKASEVGVSLRAIGTIGDSSNFDLTQSQLIDGSEADSAKASSSSEELVVKQSNTENLDQEKLDLESLDLKSSKQESPKQKDQNLAEINPIENVNSGELSQKLPPPPTLIQQTQNRHFESIQQRIVKDLEREDILQTTAGELRLLLKCDRVLISRLEQANQGLILAEAVTTTGQQATNFPLDASQFSFQHLPADQAGKVRVWEDVSQENVPTWYQEQLAALGVRAELIAPIAHQGQQFGLLIAHQCSSPRSWQEQEIDWITKIANHMGNMVENIQDAKGIKQVEPQNLADISPLPQLETQVSQNGIDKNWTKYSAEVIQRIRQSLKVTDILKASVTEIHRILDCDRALVYALNHDSYGKIVAESVSPGWTKAEGRIIQDPCFEARYLQKYSDGRYRAWNDIYQTAMTECHREQLERLEVKANLVVPLMGEGKLFGLLVVQQCSGTRNWQEAEIQWVIQIAAQVGFALDNAQLIADAQELRHQAEQTKIWAEHFAETVQQIRQSDRAKDIYRASVREVRRILSCDRLLIYGLNQDNYGKIVAESVAHGWTKGEGRVIQDPCFEARYLDKYRDGRVRVWNDIYKASMSKCHLEQLEKLEVKANLVVPITNAGKLYGLLVAQQCTGTRQWQEAEIGWMTQIAIQIAFALENAQMLETIEQNTQVTQAILARAASSSANIQQTVQSVTAGFTNLSSYTQGFAETINRIKDLSKQLAQQSMTMTKALSLSQALDNGQNKQQKPVPDLTDQVFSLMQQMFEETAKIEPLFTSIQTEIAAKTTTLESETQHLVEGVNDFQTASQKLEEIVALNQEMSNLVGNIADSLETNIQSSTFTQDSAQRLTDITKRISQQSVAIVQSFGQLPIS